ncbi:hypothetical protein GYH30_004378 [Glycine max]|nr:hypothetical protein GYH30_004378 [Glycine max]
MGLGLDIGATCLEVATKVGDGVDEEGDTAGASLIKAGGRLIVVNEVKAVDGEDGEDLFVDIDEALIVHEVEVIVEPDYCSTIESSGVGGVTGVVGSAEMVDLKEVLEGLGGRK